MFTIPLWAQPSSTTRPRGVFTSSAWSSGIWSCCQPWGVFTTRSASTRSKGVLRGTGPVVITLSVIRSGPSES
ncbi:MAG: hypothetical protein ACYC5J_06755, partial [Chloroflexota bacterium]